MGKKLSAKAEEVARSRYFMEGEDWEKCAYRVAKNTASLEKDAEGWTKIFQAIIYDMLFLPAGRILRNSGRPKGSLLNCYHLPIGDSTAEIGQFYKDSLELWSEGGGCGCDFSPLRPKGTLIKGKGGTSSGLVSFLEASDAIAATVESGGSRRAAALSAVDISHPEVEDFIDAKLVHGKLSHYNISININHQFLEAVESDKDWELKFDQKVYKVIKSKYLWEKILKNMVECGEPGLLNTTNMYKNNSYFFQRIQGVNPCGEAVLSAWEACNLGSIVLPSFLTEQGRTNWKKLEETIKVAVRFLDNIVDLNRYVIKEIDIHSHNGRRIGIGIMGTAEYLFAKGLRYGAKESITELERLMKFIRDSIYYSLVELSVEKGSFPKFDSVAYGKASFIRKLPAQLRKEIKEHGVRCVTAMALAPNGTISLLPEVTGGIEPLFSKAYLRNDRVSQRIYIHPLYADIINKKEKIPDWLVDSYDLKPEDHFEVQAICQKYTDGGVSKTINIPNDATAGDLNNWLLEYIYDLKGVTVYRDGSRDGQVLNRISHDEATRLVTAGEVVPDMEATKCARGTCEL